MNDVVKLTTFVAGVKEWVAIRIAINAVFEKMFYGNYLTNTVSECAALVRRFLEIKIKTNYVFYAAITRKQKKRAPGVMAGALSR